MESVRQLADEVLGLREPQGLPQLVLGGLRRRHPQVARHGAGEQVRVLRDHRNAFPQATGGHCPDVGTGEPDLTGSGVQEPGQQIQQCGFAAAGRADDGRGGPGGGGKGDVGQDRRLRPGIGEPDMAELHSPSVMAGPAFRRASRRLPGMHTQCRGHVQHVLDPFGADGRARCCAEDVHGHHDGQQDLQDVGDEGREGAHLHGAAADQVPAEPDHGHRGKVHHDHDHRKHSSDQERGLQVVPGQLAGWLPRNGATSCSCRTKPRMTLAPMICSRRIRLMPSISACPCR